MEELSEKNLVAVFGNCLRGGNEELLGRAQEALIEKAGGNDELIKVLLANCGQKA